MPHYIPEDYVPHLSLRDTEIAIKKVKDFFERDLAIQLNLTRVSAPLFVDRESGLNDNLSGKERPVSFDLLSGKNFEIVHSLAKWKRFALKEYDFEIGEGLLLFIHSTNNKNCPNAIVRAIHVCLRVFLFSA